MKAILVVEDEADLRAMLELVLTQAGYDVASAEDGMGAIQALRERRFDLALTDLKMPGMDGLEALEVMKSINPGIRVVIMTAFATVETAAECTARGAVAFIKKPFDLADLFAVLGLAFAPASE